MTLSKPDKPTLSKFTPTFGKLKEIHNSRTETFDNLVKISGLAPSIDFRHSDLRGVNWTGSKKEKYDLTASLEGPDIDITSLKIENLMRQVSVRSTWENRLIAAKELIRLSGGSQNTMDFLKTRLEKDKSVTFAKKLSKYFDNPHLVFQNSLKKRIIKDIGDEPALRNLIWLTHRSDDTFRFFEKQLSSNVGKSWIGRYWTLLIFVRAYKHKHATKGILIKIIMNDKGMMKRRAASLFLRFFSEDTNELKDIMQKLNANSLSSLLLAIIEENKLSLFDKVDLLRLSYKAIEKQNSLDREDIEIIKLVLDYDPSPSDNIISLFIKFLAGYHPQEEMLSFALKPLNDENLKNLEKLITNSISFTEIGGVEALNSIKKERVLRSQ